MSHQGASRLAPRLSGGIPWFGHAFKFHADPVGLLQRGRERLGDLFWFRLAGSRIHALTGPKANAAFFQAPDDQLSAKEAYRFTVPIFGPGIAYDATPDVMEEQISFLFPALKDERLRSYARVMEEEAENYFGRWPQGGEADLLTAMNELTVFISSRCLVGDEFRRRLSTEFARLYHDLEGGINLLAFFNPDLPLPSFKRRDRARRRMVEIISGIVAERRESRTQGEDFLQTLMAARGGDGKALTDEAITGLLLTSIFAGQHTSSVLACWTGALLLQNPAFLPAVLAEQDAAFAGAPEMALEALRAMGVLERAIREAERMHPPLIMLMRRILKDVTYGEYVLPAGDIAMVSPAVSQRIPDIFPDPDRYNPDRFSSNEGFPKYSMIAFGGGRHACIGGTFAYLQVKVIWSVLFRRFNLELIDRDVRPNYRTFVVGPRPPCRVRYRRKST